MADLLLISDRYTNFRPDREALGRPADVIVLGHRVPTARQLAAYRTVVLFGPMKTASRVDQLAGALELAMQDAPLNVVVALARAASDDKDVRLLNSLLPEVSYATGAFAVEPVHEGFSRYLREYARSAGYQFDPPGGATVLGRTPNAVAAFAAPVGAGVLTVLPFAIADFPVSHDALLVSMLAALDTLGTPADEVPPEFLADLRLPGEEDLVTNIADLESELGTLRDEAARLARYRHLVGRLSGDGFEALVIDALNIVLASTDLSAQDGEELRREDFWIVDSSGQKRALAEAKGIGSHVRRADVSQIDFHRSRLEDDDLQTLPGILAVNVFRNDDELERRQLPVSGEIAKFAAERGVLVMRGWDLYELVALAIREPAIADGFVEMLDVGGGWLEVADGLRLRDS